MNTAKYRWPMGLCLPALLCLLAILLPAGCGGCRDSKTAEQSGETGDEPPVGQYNDEMHLFAIDKLNSLEEYNSADSLKEIIERFDPERPPKPGQQIDPLTVIWPEPDMFREIVEQINQWLRTQPPPTDWTLDPMTASLPKPLRELPQVKSLDKMKLSQFDGLALQEAAWLHNASLVASGDAVDALDRARNLFDWTVRNIQLEPDRPNRIPQFPRETLLFGRGTASERAWVYILLLRQLDIDAAMLVVDQARGLGTSVPSSPPDKKTETAPRPWCVGVLIEGEVYLFDPVLGLPIPAPDGLTLDEAGQLAIRPATLAQVAADAKLLRRLDLSESPGSSVKSVDLKRVTPLLEASPSYLARPMKLLESHLAGERKFVLTTSPTAQASRWKAAHVADARLWLKPFETLDRRSHIDWRALTRWIPDVLPLYCVYEEHVAGSSKTSRDHLEYEESRTPKEAQVVEHPAALYKGRVLYLKGKFTGDEGAIRCFQIARPSYESLALSSADDIEKQVKLWAKQDASYWLGLIAYQRGNYPSAIDYFMTKTLEAFPNGPWSTGARYNLARTYEAAGKADTAVLLYRSNSASPGYHGDLLRAKWLRELSEKRKPESE